ncbi:MAG: type II secretion system protein [Granulosicoccus sp.]
MKRRDEHGFTLVEMAFVLLIIGLLTKTAIAPLRAIQEHGKRDQAELNLQHVRETIFAHLVAYGSLPCPLSRDNASGTQAVGVSRNTNALDDSICKVSSGWVPAYALGLSGSISSEGALLDPWGREFHYVVSLSNHVEKGSPILPDWTTPGEAANVGIKDLTSDITLCNAVPRNNCTARSVRTNQIAFVVMSAGQDSSSKGLQAENQDNDNYFVVTDESIQNGAEYDDMLVWGSAADVMYWMLRMGWLP